MSSTCDTTQEGQNETGDLLDFSGYDLLGEATCVTNDKISLIPRRVVPQIFFQESLHEGQLIFPQLVGTQHPLAVGPGMVVLGVYSEDGGCEG